MENRKSAGTFLGFVIGGLIGAAIALLYAPRPGSETRQKLIEDSEKLKDAAIDSVKQARDSTEAVIEDAWARMNIIAQETKDFVGRLKEVEPDMVKGK
jgi:gas vesicle protein